MIIPSYRMELIKNVMIHVIKGYMFKITQKLTRYCHTPQCIIIDVRYLKPFLELLPTVIEFNFHYQIFLDAC